MDIVIVTADTGHAAPTNLRDFLQGLGHDVTIMADDGVTATNLDGYEIIMAVRNDEGTSAIAALADHLRAYIAKGKWVACGGFVGNAGNTSVESPAVLLGMPGPEEVLSSSESRYQVVRTAHPITGNRAVGDTFEWLSSSEFSNHIPYDSTRGVRLSSLADYPNNSAIHLFSATDLGITPTAPGGCGIYFGCLYNRSAYGSDAPEIMQNILQARPLVISGQVIGADGNPVARKIRAYLRDSGQLAAKGESESAEGSFTLESWSEDEHTVIALPEEDGKNALIFDRVLAEPPA